MPKVPFIKPNFPAPEELAEYLERIHNNNYYSNNGPIYFEFKEAIEAYLGTGVKAVGVANATLGLMLAIRACITSDKKYIAVPSFTFAAGPLAIKWCGFEPVFFDIEPTTTQPSLESFQELYKKYSKDLAGVLLTNSFGIGNESIDEWESLAALHNLPLIIDSAPGLGSVYTDGTLLGSRGTCEVFSLHVTKPFGVGEGGLITTRDPALAEELESLKNFGFDSKKQTVRAGLNAKITELDCAIGLAILKNYPATVVDRQKTYRQFKANLKDQAVSFLPRAESSAIQFITIMVDGRKRPVLLKALEAGGIEARTYYAPAVHTFPFFADCPAVNLNSTEAVSARVTSLPLHPNMPSETINYICDTLIKGLKA